MIVVKSVEWLVLVFVLMLYLFIRSAHLHWVERIMTPIVSAGMAYSLSDSLSTWWGVNELLVAILIMVFGPLLLNVALTMAHNPEDQAFAKRTLQDWVRKWAGLEPENRGVNDNDEG